jgi:hypothetical protein
MSVKRLFEALKLLSSLKNVTSNLLQLKKCVKMGGGGQ